MTPEVKGKILKTTGFVVIGVGVYLVMLGDRLDPEFIKPPGDTIIDAEWSEVE